MKYNNHIIIEGFWGIGKTTVAKELKKVGFSLIEEPFFIEENQKRGIDKSLWFKKEHIKREQMLENNLQPVVLERSELSTFAYDYVTNGKMPSEKDIRPLINTINKKKVLLVYLSTAGADSLIKIDEIAHNKDVRNIIENKRKANSYEQWYTSVLLEKFGITFLQINLVDGQRKTPKDITKNILECLENDRIAQANVVVCRKNKTGELDILVLKRVKSRGGFWQTVTGGIHIGENLLQAAKRELGEELSVSVKEVTYTGFTYSFMATKDFRLHEYVCFTVLSYKQSLGVKISDEHDEYKWLTPKDAIRLLKFDDNKTAVKKVIKKVRF